MQTRRKFIQTIPAAGAAFAVGGYMLTEASPAMAQGAAPATGHFHPRGKAPSKFTREILEKARGTLPFADKRDLDEQKKGLIAPMKELKIMADAGHVAWDMERFQFLDQQDDFDSIHPSLLRQSRLNQNYGLYKVTDGIYQVRGFDLSDISFVRGKTGWIVIDPLISAEVVRAAWKLFQEHAGEGLPVSAVIYSHSHADHWGGVRGILSEEDLKSGRIEIIAPRDFMNHTISENVYAGNAMNRRLVYQYGLNLPVGPHGYVGQGLGQNTSAGAVGLFAPTRIVEDEIEEMTVDGVLMIHQNTPNTEAPSEMNTYFPEHNSRGVVQRFLGFWDCNPTTLIPLSPEDSAPLYVEMMGGAGKILAKGQELINEGKYKHATEILDRLVHAEPDNRAAKDLLADAFEQLGYQQENPGLRNSFLAGALELRSGIPQDPIPSSSTPDVIRAMSTELFLNFLGIRMDSRKAEGMRFTINLVTPDNGEKFIIELDNATLTNIEGYLADKPDLTLTINRSDLELTMMGAKQLEAQIADGTCKAEGDLSILKQLASTMVEFDPRFEILPGTHPAPTATDTHNPYEVVPGAPIAE